MNILVSYCFLGEPCRYDGCSRLDRQVIELHKAGHTLVPVCPEVLGGLDTPRAPAEVQADGRVITEDGEDVTDAYRAGAEAALKIARSPSCGCGEIYDGSFTHTIKAGWGVTARLLAEAGLRVMDEENLESWLYDPTAWPSEM